MVTGIQFPQKSVFLGHPALLVRPALKLELQEVSGALMQQVLSLLESDGSGKQSPK